MIFFAVLSRMIIFAFSVGLVKGERAGGAYLHTRTFPSLLFLTMEWFLEDGAARGAG